jgi:hypothetical protein
MERMDNRTADTAQRLAARATERAQDLAARADTHIERATGRPLMAWTEEASRAIRDYPVRAVLAAVALGYLVGKVAWRRR